MTAQQPTASVIRLSVEEWDNNYAPMMNPFEPDTDIFETYGDSLEFIMSVPEEHVWTQVDGDNGGIYIVNGRRFVNRVHYYFTARAHDPKQIIEVLVMPDECEPDQHEWGGFSPSKAQVESGVDPAHLDYACTKCFKWQADLEMED